LEIILNGDTYILNEALNLHQFLNEKINDIEKIVVEYNYEIVKKESWKNLNLKSGDRIEVLRFVGGG
jgi:sulfur carrier protein